MEKQKFADHLTIHKYAVYYELYTWVILWGKELSALMRFLDCVYVCISKHERVNPGLHIRSADNYSNAARTNGDNIIISAPCIYSYRKSWIWRFRQENSSVKSRQIAWGERYKKKLSRIYFHSIRYKAHVHTIQAQVLGKIDRFASILLSTLKPHTIAPSV